MVKSKSYFQYGCALIGYLIFYLVEVECGMLAYCSPLKGEICVELTKCPFFVKSLNEAPNPRPRSLIKRIQQYHCGYVGLTPKVCCTFATETVAIHSVRDPPDVKKHPNLYMLPKNSCGQTTYRSRITGGIQTSPMKFPWMAILAFKTEKNCEQPSTCTNLHECKPFMDFLRKMEKPLQPPIVAFLREQQCGFIGRCPKICCKEIPADLSIFKDMQTTTEEEIPRPTEVPTGLQQPLEEATTGSSISRSKKEYLIKNAFFNYGFDLFDLFRRRRNYVPNPIEI